MDFTSNYMKVFKRYLRFGPLMLNPNPVLNIYSHKVWVPGRKLTPGLLV